VTGVFNLKPDIWALFPARRAQFAKYINAKAAYNDNQPHRERTRLLPIAGRVDPSGWIVFSQDDEPAPYRRDIEPGFPNDPREA
jgi:hypothetical protein